MNEDEVTELLSTPEGRMKLCQYMRDVVRGRMLTQQELEDALRDAIPKELRKEEVEDNE